MRETFITCWLSPLKKIQLGLTSYHTVRQSLSAGKLYSSFLTVWLNFWIDFVITLLLCYCMFLKIIITCLQCCISRCWCQMFVVFLNFQQGHWPTCLSWLYLRLVGTRGVNVRLPYHTIQYNTIQFQFIRKHFTESAYMIRFSHLQ